MSLETDLHTLLSGICPRVFPDVADEGATRPFVTWQGLTGYVLRDISNTPADKRNTIMQINVWANTRLEAVTMIRQIEDAMYQSSSFVAYPETEPLSSYDPDPPTYGSIQRFTIISSR